MTTSTYTPAHYVGNGVTKTFGYDWRIFAATDLLVVVTDLSGTESTLTYGVDYSVDGVGAAKGGSIQLTSALATGWSISIRLRLPLVQGTSFRNQGDFSPVLHEDAMDYLTKVCQQQQEQLDRCLKPTQGVVADLDAPSEGTVLGWVQGRIRNLSSATALLAAGLLSGATGQGTSLVTFCSPATGAIPRTLLSKLTDQVNVMDFGAIGNGISNPLSSITSLGPNNTTGWTLAQWQTIYPFATALTNELDWCAIQAAINAAAGAPVYLPGKVFVISQPAGAAYVLTATTNTLLVGVKGQTSIKLNSATSACAMIGSATGVTSFRTEGITWDGNTSAFPTIATCGVYFPVQCSDYLSIRSTFQNFHPLTTYYGAVSIGTAGGAVNARFDSISDTMTGIDNMGIMANQVLQASVWDGYFSGFVYSPFNFNPYTAGSINSRSSLNIVNNVCIQGASFPAGISVISLMGDDINCYGNKVVGGGIGIVVHSAAGYTSQLRNVLIAGNSVWQTVNDGISVRQDVTTNVVVAENKCWQCGAGNSGNTVSGAGIAVRGLYAGAADNPAAPGEASPGNPGCLVANNVIYDGIGTGGYNYGGYGNEPSGVCLFQAINVVVSGNVINAPRYAGIYALYDCKNILICNNIIKDHYGKASTSAATWYGAPILLQAQSAAAFFGNIDVLNNLIDKYGISQSAAPANSVRWGGISVQGSTVLATNVRVAGNRINGGYGSAICTLSTSGFVGLDNQVTNLGSGCLAFNPNAVDTGMNVSRVVILPDAGSAVASAATIAPVAYTFHVTGTAAIATITPPWAGFTGTIRLIPDAAFTTVATGNIALASTAVVNKALLLTYDGAKWYPSY